MDSRDEQLRVAWCNHIAGYNRVDPLGPTVRSTSPNEIIGVTRDQALSRGWSFAIASNSPESHLVTIGLPTHSVHRLHPNPEHAAILAMLEALGVSLPSDENRITSMAQVSIHLTTKQGDMLGSLREQHPTATTAELFARLAWHYNHAASQADTISDILIDDPDANVQADGLMIVVECRKNVADALCRNTPGAWKERKE